MTASLDSTFSVLDLLDEEDDWMPEGDEQREYISYATIVLRQWFQQRTDVYVTGNLQLLYDPNNSKNWLAPDTFVVFGSSQRNRTSYKIWEEGQGPAFVLEITSESTFKRDNRDKKLIYQDLRVQEYIQYDPTGRYLRPEPLVGYRLVAGEYQPIPLHRTSGIPTLFSEVLQLELRQFSNGLRFYDPVSQTTLKSHDEERTDRLRERQARIEAQQAKTAAEQALLREQQTRIEAEQARIEAEQLARRLAEQLKALGIEPDQPHI